MSKEIVQTDQAPAAIGPYSQGIKAGNLFFVSGQTPIDPATGKLVEGDIQAQTKQVLNNIKEILQAGGSSMENIVKATVYLADFNNFAKMNEIYGQFFSNEKPTRVCVEVSRLPLDCQVEIDAIALI